ncbi:MAG: hypothetical protein J6A59_11335, partial [Lachnospiraceae bacterium]|nr:hypothetical protein [Lachnospiraceae bacterium]
MSIELKRKRGGQFKGDLLGNIFKDIEVLESVGRGRYRCRCKCSAEKIMAGGDIRRGRGITCNHFKDVEMQKLIGTHFGDLEVIDVRGALCICRCKCGNIVEHYISGLRQGNISSCGCLRERKRKELTGRKFGSLEVIEYIGYDKYKCHCNICENDIEVEGSNLRNGSYQSCGCNKNKLMRSAKDKYLGRCRTDKQLKALNSKEDLADFIKDIAGCEKISISELSIKLGINYSNTYRYIQLYNLDYMIDHSSGSSKEEMEIAEFIENELGLSIDKHNRKILGNGKELDIYIPSKRVAIEFNGDYWHNEVSKDVLYHQNKTIECAKKGIRLIHIFEYEYVKNKDRILTYLKNVLNDHKKIIYGRETKIEEIGNQECSSFLRDNHLQGDIKSKIRIGI